MKKLDVSILKLILTHDSLQISDEDLLYLQICEFGEGYEELFECIKFENLSSTKISEFLNQYNFGIITNQIWHSLIRRLELPVSPVNDCHRFYPDIYDYLINKYIKSLDSIVLHGRKNFVSSSNSHSDIYNIIFPDNETFVSFVLLKSKPQWIEFNFFNRSVIIRKILLIHQSTTGVELSLSGSNDEKNYFLIDVLKNPMKRDQWYEYQLPKSRTKYKFIRLNFERNDNLERFECLGSGDESSSSSGQKSQKNYQKYEITKCRLMGLIK
ncbi:hypothetical protein TRFO_12557 [Tritrichomonas foetus]|uniref:Uncharacterized protein n=1 Tax=Tritrichomonas foetus TaxID=1144522 RepID=A0A1J4L1D3_9EUKA|nr:hypothetical protein TRFO_12557 [Tritrichomonas foetus]|eukprot:OHT17226.1 hypothetical protein TRFO_12557 [Tritrichomonas foetus]